MTSHPVRSILSQILTALPEDWTTLTTHRLDIYDESQAKVEFTTEFTKLIEQGRITTEALAALPTAFDYVRLGHQLSSVLEWAVAEMQGISSEQVISFASKTMPIMAILRSNTIAGKQTMVYHDDSLPPALMLPEVRSIYGYNFETCYVDSQEGIVAHEDSIVIFISNAPLHQTRHPAVDFTLNLSSEFGSVLMVTPRQSASKKQWVSEIQHVRRRESIAATPPYALRMLQTLVDEETTPLEELSASDLRPLYEAIQVNTGSAVVPLIASSGLSTQYAIMMGLLDHARQQYPGKKIQFLIPPNCYGGTNDQARRVVALASDVSIVDLPVDSGHSMTKSLERRLQQAALLDAVPYILVEIPTNPRVEVPDMQHLEKVLTTKRLTANGATAVPPLFIVDQTFCPNVPLLSENSSLAGVQTLAYVSGSKFPSGGRCTAGYVTANAKAEGVMVSLEKHLYICDNQATPLQMRVLAESMPSMQERIQQAYLVTKQFVDHIRNTLPNTKISFIDDALVEQGFTPSVFSLDLPSTGSTPEEREEHKRLLNLRLINHMIEQFPEGAKHCVSYGQLRKSYWTVPATSTQGTTKEADKDYIVRIALPPEIDIERLLRLFDEFSARENLISLR